MNFLVNLTPRRREPQRVINSQVMVVSSNLAPLKALKARCVEDNPQGGCSSDIASSYFFRSSKVTEHVTSWVNGGGFRIK